MSILPRSILLKVVGNGPQLEPAIEFCMKHGMDNVAFLGFRSGSELDLLVSGAKFTVVPSEWFENLPFTMLESFCFGKPVIATDIGEFATLMPQMGVGKLFRMKDSDELSVRIHELWESPSEVAKMGKSARSYAERYLTPDFHYMKLQEIFSAIRARGLNG
jgi:glycosyltransferase involved in cell wall biosynthesis